MMEARVSGGTNHEGIPGFTTAGSGAPGRRGATRRDGSADAGAPRRGRRQFIGATLHLCAAASGRGAQALRQRPSVWTHRPGQLRWRGR